MMGLEKWVEVRTQAEGRGAQPAVVIWDGRGQAALLQLLPTRGHRLLGTTPPVGAGQPPVATTSQPARTHAAPLVTVDVLAFVTCPGNLPARIAGVGSPEGTADVAVTCFLAPPLADPSGQSPGGLGSPANTVQPPRGALVPAGESCLFDVWRAHPPAGLESRVVGLKNGRTGTGSSWDRGEERADDDEALGSVTVSVTAGGDALVPGRIVQARPVALMLW